MFKDSGLEDVDAGVDRVAQGLFNRRFLLEMGNPILIIGDHHAVAAHLVLRNPLGHQTGQGAFLLVATDGFAQVQIDEGVTAENNECVVKEVLEVLDLFQTTG